MNLPPYIYGWAVLVGIVLGLAIRRQWVASHEDDKLHLAESEAPLIARQIMVGRSIDTIDRWGQGLTILVLVYGLALLGVYLYGVWLAGAKSGM